MVGEAAGISEAATGIPFIGPSGKLLDELIYKELSDWDICITNSVVCVPYTDESLATLEAPKKANILACNKRLAQFIEIVFSEKEDRRKKAQKLNRPKVIVALGAVAARAVKLLPNDNLTIFEAPHPAAILRQGEQMRYDYQLARLRFKEVHNHVRKTLQ